MKNLKNKISTIFITMIIILGTLCTCYAAAEIFGEVIIDSQHTHTYPNGSYIPYSNLNDYYDVFCCQKGTALPSEAQTNLIGSNGDNLGVSYPYLTTNDIGMTILNRRTAFPSKTYTNKTIGRYKIASTNIATPKEAYVLSEMIKVDGMGEYNYAQIAWWTTRAGSTGNKVEENAFAKEADAFEAYILEVSKAPTVDDLKHKTATFKTADGTVKTYENAFDFKYEPEWVNTDEYKKPTVVWDRESQKFTIGPFAIDYVGSTEQFGDREEVQFAGITDMEIYTDASDQPLVLGKDWEFVWVDGERTQDTDSKYPLANEKFYIRLNYIDDATKITNIKTKFRYMNAAASYQKLEGKYFDATWKQKSKDHYTTVRNQDGTTSSQYDYTEYWLKLTSMQEKASQRLALGLNGARWYEYTEIDRRLDIRSGKIRIEKDVVDEDGEEVNDVNKYFYFKVNVDGALNSGTETIKVKAGHSATSKVYYWLAGSERPTYTVKELSKDGFKEVEIENDSGHLKEDGTVKVRAKNIKQNEGSLEIIKKIDKTTLNGKESNLDGKTFNFKVKLSGTFKYNGNKYNNTSTTIDASITIVNGRGTWNSGTIKWYGETAPTYKVVELSSPEAELVTIAPSSGSLANNETVRVTAINEQKVEKAKIKIIKTLQDADKYSQDEIMKLKFNFEISVEGYDKQTVEVPALRQGNSYVWEYTSDYYEWLYGNNPKYTITEVNNPDGTEFVTGSSDDVQVSVDGTTLSGVLVSDSNKNFTVTNNIINKINKLHTGKIELTKHVDSDKLIDKDYKFVITVNGTFDYKGTHYDNKTIQLTNDSAIEIPNDNYNDEQFVIIHVDSSKVSTWTSDEFTWYGDNAPKYKVEENLLGEDIASSIEPSEGYLSDTENGVIKVTAWNRDNAKAGYIHIIKKLENADKCSVDYVKSLVFKFKISVDGYEPYIVSLTAERVNNEYVWEYTSDKFSWKADEEAPHYTIEEIDVPEGTRFVSANGEESTTVSGQLKESVSDEILITTDATYINTVVDNSGNLIIDKKVTDGCLNGKEFKFRVTLKGTFEYNGTQYNNEEFSFEATVNGGSKWDSGIIKWYGKEAPTYTVEELESDIAEVTSVINASGTVKPGTNVNIATFTNKAKTTGGYLQITKKIDSNIATDDDFYFKVTVDGYEPFIVKIKANQTYKSDIFVWNIADKAPSYTVEEIDIPEGAELVRIDNATGTLAENSTVNVVAFNKYEEHEGNFTIKKEIIADEKLLDGLALPKFEMEVTISGTFEMNGESVVDSTRVINISLAPNETYTSPNIKWWGNNAPSVTVNEINIPTGWKNVGISNNGGEIADGLEIVVTNQLDTLTVIDLTMKLAGNVWEDVAQDLDGKNTPDSVPNGKMDDNEERLDGIEVYIYDDSGNLATIYDDGTEISQPLLTSANGYWEAPSVKVLKLGGYDVEFRYDGQTYEPTKFLATSNGDANAYKAASTSERDNWEKDSKALDFDREEVNNRIQKIFGNSPIDGNGNTLGTVEGTNGTADINYAATNLGQNTTNNDLTQSSRLISEVQTKNTDGTIIDLFKANARTSVGGLTYPFDKRVHLESTDTYINELGLVQYYKYSATYNYMLNINLGLVKREKADLGATKDLYSAKVLVNERLLNYRFNTLDDYGKDVLSRQFASDTMGIKYQLGLYHTDYFYRAELYQTNPEVYDAVEEFYKNLGVTPEDSELDVYLTYKINLYNESPSYLVGINQVVDYFDSSFGKPIDTKVTKYIQTVDGKENAGMTEVANGSTLTTTNGAESSVKWDVTQENLKGSDGITYNKMVADLSGIKLASGEKAEIFVTFKVGKDNMNGVQNAVKLGNKSNIVEISNYSTYYSDGSVAGKIDGDSAPDNVNIANYNERSWYEDDTDQAPILELTMLNDSRKVQGLAWEDNSNDGTVGKYDDNEALIGGLTTELIEKVKVQKEGTYTEYDFLWPTNKSLDCLGGKTLEYLTGFDSTTETSRTNVENVSSVGGYKFTGVPTGNYVVRFIYGNDKTDLDDTLRITSDPVALNKDGSSYSGNENILTANYDEDREGVTPAVYNGQDYKSTIYQLGFASTDFNGYVNNEWHNLDDKNLAETRVSDVRDSEARRLELIAKSETITNTNGTVLATANDKTANHTDLYDNYNMFADTAKLNLNILGDGVEKEEVRGTVFEGSSIKVNEDTTNYTVTNIDCGLIERPETELVLDKEISSIKLTTNDQKVIFNAIYDISYDLEGALLNNLSNKVVIAEIDGKYLVANVKLNEASIGTDVLQALDKNENKLTRFDAQNGGTQNFRFVNIDDTILQGTTIEINYLMTALNVGDKDMTSTTLDKISETALANQTKPKDEILALASKVNDESRKSSTTDSVVKIGEYLGTTYYTGNEGNDVVVTTKVRQVVDYVDNDAIFSQEYNLATNHSWRNTTTTELSGSGYGADRLLDKSVLSEYELIDKNNITYISDQRNNVILSVDETENKDQLSNSGFEVALVPYTVDENGYKSNISLTVTKTVSAQDDANNLTYDNIAEIVKTENTVGRRDVAVIHGNSNPKLGEFMVALKERDSSATELVTFTPPTGIRAESTLTLQILAVVLIALVIVSVGIVIIKKKVLK